MTMKSAIAACLVAAFLVSQSSVVLAAGNLIVNPGAEAGTGSSDGNTVEPVPGWTTVGDFTVVQYGAPGGFPTSSDPGPPDRGSNFFAGGPDNPSSSASQLLNVSAYASSINAGQATFTLSGWLGGFDSQDDNAVLSATFMNSGGTTLGSGSIGPVLAADRGGVTGMLFETTSGFVPIGTVTVDINLQMTREEGSYNDGYADNLSFSVSAQSVPEPASIIILTSGVLGMMGYGWHRAGLVRSPRTGPAKAGGTRSLD